MTIFPVVVVMGLLTMLLLVILMLLFILLFPTWQEVMDGLISLARQRSICLLVGVPVRIT